MVMPFDSAVSRAPVTGEPLLLGPSPEMSMTRRRPLIRILVEQRHREIDRARDRGARGPADRGLHDLVGDGVGGFRAVDHPPGNDDLLVAGGRPFEIGHGDLAVRAALERLQKFLGDDGLRITLALDRQLIHVHRIGDIDGEHQFDIDRWRAVLVGRCDDLAGWAARKTRNVAAGHRSRDQHRPDRDTPAHSGPPIVGCDGDMQIRLRKAGTSIAYTFKFAACRSNRLNFGETVAPPRSAMR